MRAEIVALLNTFNEALKADVEAARQRQDSMRRLLDLIERYAQEPAVEISPREQQIIEAVGDGKLTGEQIAAILKVEYTGSFKQILASMVKRGLLANEGRGYVRGPAAPVSLPPDGPD